MVNVKKQISVIYVTKGMGFPHSFLLLVMVDVYKLNEDATSMRRSGHTLSLGKGSRDYSASFYLFDV